jgi:DNA-binding NarL/FixJ family response regulator
MCAEKMPDLILMDIEMINGDGLEATQRIKKDFPEVMILILSIADGFQTAAVVLSGDVGGYIQESVGSDGLISTVRTAVVGLGICGSEINEMIKSVFYFPKTGSKTTAFRRYTLSALTRKK